MNNSFKESIKINPENSNNNIDKKGKHYAMSDIHGMYGSYMQALGKLSKDDEIFIIGDVIDRGEHGIKILLDIIERQKNPGEGPKVTFLMGNHEVMLLSTVDIMLNNNWTAKEVQQLIESDNLEEFLNRNKRKDIGTEEVYFMMNWLKRNQGEETGYSYFRDITPSQMKEIYNFLLNSYIILPQKIGNEDYLFVHAMPVNNKIKLEEMKSTGKGYNITEVTPEEYCIMLSERSGESYKLAQDVGFTTICGHTPRYGEIENNKENGFVRIDAGCGHRKETSKLALYCIDDDKVEYIDEKREMDFNEAR